MEDANMKSGEIQSPNEQKLADAREAIAEIFQATDLEYLRVELWHFLKAVTTEKPFSFLGDPSTVLTMEKHLNKIITACRLILDVEEDQQGDLPAEDFQPFSQQQIEADRQCMKNLRELNDQYGGMIRRLTLAETERPILAIKRFFKAYKYEEWQEILADWVEYGLSKVSICEATGECAEIIQYELLESLLEAIYLIWLQDEDICYPKRRFRKLDGRKSVIELLVAALEPELIFEVNRPHSTSSTRASYRDLLIILLDKNHRPFKDLEPTIEMITAGEDNVYCSLHKFSGLHQSLEAGHVYFSRVCIPENVVYQRTFTKLPVAPAEKMLQVLKKSKEEFTIGLDKAEKCYQGARHYQQIQAPALAMFALHQAVEMVFRTVAISLYGHEKKTHSIKTLKRYNRRLAPQLNDVFPADTPKEERLLMILEDAYLNGRYNMKYEVDHSDVDTIFNRVAHLLKLALDVFHGNSQMATHQ